MAARHIWDVTMDGEDAIEKCTNCGLKTRKRHIYTGGGVRLVKTNIVSEYFVEGEWRLLPKEDERIHCKNNK